MLSGLSRKYGNILRHSLDNEKLLIVIVKTNLYLNFSLAVGLEFVK